ncbi:unnamed protein product, partial [Mesorhabditis belari]|uniref:Paired domain-containing protein n=1 Tax=Mesorhabditis belari TaxID=2138241 RepID=A0AAF3FLD3_9BILA
MTKPSAHRNSIIQLHKGGTRAIDISKRLKVSKKLVSTTIARFKELGTNFDRKGRGNKRSVINKAIIKKVRDRVRLNPFRPVRKMASQLKVSKSSMGRILRNHLHFKAYKLRKAQLLTDAVKKKREQRAKDIRQRFNGIDHRISIPDLNPMDFSVWSVLESQACAKSHKTVESLKKALQKAWEAIDPQYLLATLADQYEKAAKNKSNGNEEKTKNIKEEPKTDIWHGGRKAKRRLEE